MSTGPLDERINARAQLQHVARGLYEDPTGALRSMRYDAHLEGADAVRRNLERDFTHYGAAKQAIGAPARERAQNVLREGVALDVQRWLSLDHTAPPLQLPTDREIQPVMQGLAADPPSDAADLRWDSPQPKFREPLTPDEQLAYDQIGAYADARAKAREWQAAEARLHGIQDHRAHLDVAEQNLPRARSAMREEVSAACRDGDSAVKRIEADLARNGPVRTAERIRSGALLKGDLKPIAASPRFGIFPRRDREAEAEVLERLAKRVETIGYYEGDLGKWSRFEPESGPPVQGAKNVRAALDHEEARILGTSGVNRTREDLDRSRVAPPHPSREASRLERVMQKHLDALPPESRERVLGAAHMSGGDRIGAAIGHLQTIQMAARTFREGIEGPSGQ